MPKKPVYWSRQALFARAWFVAGRTLDFTCRRCGATGVTMADKCNSDLAERCPGFEAQEKAHQDFEENYQTIIDGGV
jgi:ribosomal protein L40E